MAGVQRGTWLIEVLRVGCEESIVRIRLAGFTGYRIAQDALCRGVDHRAVAVWIIRAGWQRGHEHIARADEPLVPGLGLH